MQALFPTSEVPAVLASIGYAVAYTAVGMALLALGYFALDLLTPGHLGRHIYENRSANAATVLAAGFLGQGAIIFATIWINGTSGFGTALLDTVVFGILGIVLQAVAFVLLDLITPGKLGEHLVEPRFTPAAIGSAAAEIAVAAIIVASIWP